MYAEDKILIGCNENTNVFLSPKLANRHGLIAGATGTGKTITLKTLAEYMQSPPFTTMSFGVMVVLVFSRAFGMGKLWKLVMGDNFNRLVKNVAEEGTELFGYSIIFLAAIEYACYLLNKKEIE